MTFEGPHRGPFFWCSSSAQRVMQPRSGASSRHLRESPREARQAVAGAIAERPHWRNVRTAQGSVAGNTCPPRGEDQSNRDESRVPAQAGRGGETGNLYAQQYQIGRHTEGGYARPPDPVVPWAAGG